MRIYSPVDDVSSLHEEVDAAGPVALLVYNACHLEHLLGIGHVPVKIAHGYDAPGERALYGLRRRRRWVCMVGVVVVVVIDDVNGLKGLLLGVRAAKDVRVGLLVGVDGERPGEREAEGGDDGAVGPENGDEREGEGEECKKARHVYCGGCGCMRPRRGTRDGPRDALAVGDVAAVRAKAAARPERTRAGERGL